MFPHYRHEDQWFVSSWHLCFVFGLSLFSSVDCKERWGRSLQSAVSGLRVKDKFRIITGNVKTRGDEREMVCVVSAWACEPVREKASCSLLFTFSSGRTYGSEARSQIVRSSVASRPLTAAFHHQTDRISSTSQTSLMKITQLTLYFINVLVWRSENIRLLVHTVECMRMYMDR